MSKELIKNTGTYLFTGFAGQGLVLLLWILLARWLSPEQIGLYALALFLIDIFGVLCISGLDAVITRFYYSGVRTSSVLNHAVVIFSFSSFLTVLLFLAVSPLILMLIPGLHAFLDHHLLLTAAVIIATSMANFSLAHYTALRKALSYSTLVFSKTLLFCGLAALLVYLGFGVPGILYGLLLSSSAIVIFFFFTEIDFSRLSMEPRLIGEMASYGFPLLLYAASNVIAAYFGRILLDRYTDLATLGIYSFFLTLTLQINGLWSSFNRAWTPEVFSRFEKDQASARDRILFMGYAASFFYLSILVLFLASGRIFLFDFLFDEAYLSKLEIFHILLLAPLFSGIYTVAYPLYYYENKTGKILAVSLILNLLNVGLAFLMIRLFHETGAALSYLLISVLTVFVYLFAFRKSMAVAGEMIRWSVILTLLMGFNIAVLLATSSSLLFLSVSAGAAAYSFRKVRLSNQRIGLKAFFEEIRNRFAPAESGRL